MAIERKVYQGHMAKQNFDKVTYLSSTSFYYHNQLRFFTKCTFCYRKIFTSHYREKLNQLLRELTSGLACPSEKIAQN